MSLMHGKISADQDQSRTVRHRQDSTAEQAKAALARALAPAAHLHEQEQAERERQAKELKSWRGLLESLAAAENFTCPGTDEEFAREWATQWFAVSGYLKENGCAHLAEVFILPDDPSYAAARVIMCETLKGADRALVAHLILESMRAFENQHRLWYLRSFFLLLREAVQEYQSPVRRTASSVEPVSKGSAEDDVRQIRLRIRKETAAIRAIKAAHALRASNQEWIEARALGAFGLSEDTVFSASTEGWVREVDYIGTNSNRRSYARAKLIEFVLYTWLPQAKPRAKRSGKQAPGCSPG
ncbi:MAG: hypothetical protein HUU28_08050 [Planctomycetaceae bacterium]|nr:hypothetical protein [Planctomycetaceae bacterium]